MQDLKSLIGSNVYDSNHERVGILQDIYVDDETNKPTWATVRTGLWGQQISFVPLRLARKDDNGLVVGVSKEQVKEAPRIEPDGEISPDEELNLYQYYKDILRRDLEQQKAGMHERQDQEKQHDGPGQKQDAEPEEEPEAPVGVRTSRDSRQTYRGHDEHGHPVRRVRIRKYIITEVIEPIHQHKHVTDHQG